MEQNKFERHTAIKIIIKELLEGEYVQEQENNPNYLLNSLGEKVYRSNLMGVILNKEIQGSVVNFLLDDGTGKITLRFFENHPIIEKLNVGDSVLIIGRLRIYNQEKYISPEIVKQIDPLWLKLRALEMKKFTSQKEIPKNKEEKEEVIEIKQEIKEPEENKVEVSEVEEVKEEKSEKLIDENNSEEIQEDELLPVEKVKRTIEELDIGDGVLIEELISKSPVNDTEEIVERMLENGDIFQNLPGKVKVL